MGTIQCSWIYSENSILASFLFLIQIILYFHFNSKKYIFDKMLNKLNI